MLIWGAALCESSNQPNVRLTEVPAIVVKICCAEWRREMPLRSVTSMTN